MYDWPMLEKAALVILQQAGGKEVEPTTFESRQAMDNLFQQGKCEKKWLQKDKAVFWIEASR
ncbi:MAG: hypothetical protein AAF478_03640 [Pseudomonadota bacterium]